MKTNQALSVTLLASMFVLTLACSEIEPDEPIVGDPPESILGEWKLTEQKIGDGTPGTWKNADYVWEYNFKSDGTFDVNYEIAPCPVGTYELSSDTLFLNYNLAECAELRDAEEMWNIIQADNGDLVLSPRHVICIEGCQYRFALKN